MDVLVGEMTGLLAMLRLPLWVRHGLAPFVLVSLEPSFMVSHSSSPLPGFWANVHMVWYSSRVLFIPHYPGTEAFGVSWQMAVAWMDSWSNHTVVLGCSMGSFSPLEMVSGNAKVMSHFLSHPCSSLLGLHD